MIGTASSSRVHSEGVRDGGGAAPELGPTPRRTMQTTRAKTSKKRGVGCVAFLSRRSDGPPTYTRQGSPRTELTRKWRDPGPDKKKTWSSWNFWARGSTSHFQRHMQKREGHPAVRVTRALRPAEQYRVVGYEAMSAARRSGGSCGIIDTRVPGEWLQKSVPYGDQPPKEKEGLNEPV